MSDPDSNLVLFRRVPDAVRRAAPEDFARRLRDEVAGGRRFVCLITDDRDLRRLNRKFRGQDHATDVLSFPEAEGLGEMAISWQRAGEQARRYGHSLAQELRVLMLHGVLHLLGMDHETDRGRMARTETRWRRKFGLPDGLIERARSGQAKASAPPSGERVRA